jgi:hypothetical protein
VIFSPFGNASPALLLITGNDKERRAGSNLKPSDCIAQLLERVAFPIIDLLRDPGSGMANDALHNRFGHICLAQPRHNGVSQAVKHQTRLLDTQLW